MGNTYTRQSSFTDGDVITADLFNNEYDQLLAAFAASTGHTHDGTTAEGGPITKLLGTGITIGDGTSGTDITVTFDGESNDGELKWMEDEDYFEFSDDLLIASTEKIQFRDTAIYINSSADGQLDLVADTEIQIAATTVDINGAVDVSGNLSVGGNLDVTGTFDLSDSNFTNAGNIQLDSISGDSDTNTSIEFSGSDVITITTGGETQVTFNNGSILPTTDNDIDLGSASYEFKDGYFDGTVYADAINFNGTAIAATAAEINIVDGDTSATATTVADADRVVLNDNGTMVQVAVTDLAAYFDDEITAMPNLVTTAATTVGALNSGSITSGFGSIDNGSSTITTTGLISGGSLDIDDVLINGTNIGHTDDTDLITLANGVVTVAGEVSVTTLDIGGTNVTSTAAELNILDGVTATATELNYNDTGSAVGTVVASKVVTVDSNKDVASFRNITLTGELDAGSLDISGDADIDGTLEADAITVNGTALSSVIAGTTVSNATTAANVTVTDSSANTNFPVVFHDESNALLDDTGALRYNPSTGTLLAPNLVVAGTTTTVNTVTMEAENAIIFEGATADAHETTLTIIDPTADRTINLPNQSGTIPVLAAVSTTQISSTPEELNILDGATVVVGEINYLDLGSTAVGNAVASKAVVLDSNKDYTGVRNFTLSGELDAGSLDVSGDIDVDGTTNLDAVDIDGAVQIDGTITVGANDQGYDVIFYGDTASANVTWDTSADDLIFNGAAGLIVPDGQLTLGSTAVSSTAAELNILDGATATSSEINLLDGDTSVGGSITLADGDGFIVNDGGTMKTIPATDVKTYAAGSAATKGFAIAMAIVFG